MDGGRTSLAFAVRTIAHAIRPCERQLCSTNPDSGGRRQRRRAELESVLQTASGREGGGYTRSHRFSPLTRRRKRSQAVLRAATPCLRAGATAPSTILFRCWRKPMLRWRFCPGVSAANALAHDLGLPMNVTAAAKAVLNATPRRVALGPHPVPRLRGQARLAFFYCGSGCGSGRSYPFYKLHTGTKHRMGMAAYYAKAWHLWFTHPMTRFVGGIRRGQRGTEASRRHRVDGRTHPEIWWSAAGIGSRSVARSQRSAAGVSAPPAVWLIFSTSLAVCCVDSRRVPGIDLAYSESVSCQYRGAELSPRGRRNHSPRSVLRPTANSVGTLPAEIKIVPDALTLLAPSR